MCNLTDYITKEQVTGYKVAMKKYKHYYSPIIGNRYELGKIKIPKVQHLYLSGFAINLLQETSYAFRETMVGRTSVVATKRQAKQLLNYYGESFHVRPGRRCQLVLLKMAISSKIMRGTIYDRWNVYAGKEIVSIEEVN